MLQELDEFRTQLKDSERTPIKSMSLRLERDKLMIKEEEQL